MIKRYALSERRMKRHAIFAGKLALSAAALWVIVMRINTDRILFQLSDAKLGYLFCALFATLITVPIVGARWSMISAQLGFDISREAATRATFAGLFVARSFRAR